MNLMCTCICTSNLLPNNLILGQNNYMSVYGYLTDPILTGDPKIFLSKSEKKK